MITENRSRHLTFEPMHMRDLHAVITIERECFAEPWSESYFRLALKRPRSYEHFYVARDAGDLIGYIVFSVIYEEAHILNIAVAAAQQRRGIGKYLLAAALGVIQDAGGCEVFLEVAVSNLPAQYLYRQFGFRIIGIRKNYYGRSKDAYVFRKGDETDAV